MHATTQARMHAHARLKKNLVKYSSRLCPGVFHQLPHISGGGAGYTRRTPTLSYESGTPAIIYTKYLAGTTIVQSISYIVAAT
jgi:hypothetical protein